jgi:hypothetical protein
MTQSGTPERMFYTNPNTGEGIACVVLAEDDGSYEIELSTGLRGVVSAGDLYRLDESGRYLGGPQ